jgi:hypothetical protein
MEILNQMDEESRERLRKKEIQVYTRKKNAPETLPSDPRLPRGRPPLPSSDSPPPQPILPKSNDIDLNIDMANILAKVNIHVPLTEIMKIPSMRDKVKRFLSIQEESEDPPILLQANHFERSKRNMHLFSSL